MKLIKRRIRSISDLKESSVRIHLKNLEKMAALERSSRRSGLEKAWKDDINRKKSKNAWEYRKIKNRQIYIIICNDAFKVGISDDPLRRLAILQVGNPNLCRLHAVWNPRHAPSLEKTIHFRLKRFHIRGEWFHIDGLETAISIIGGYAGCLPVLISV